MGLNQLWESLLHLLFKKKYVLSLVNVFIFSNIFIIRNKNSTSELILTPYDKQKAARKSVFIPRCEWHSTGTFPQHGQIFFEFTFSIFVSLHIPNFYSYIHFLWNWKFRQTTVKTEWLYDYDNKTNGVLDC